MNAMSLLPGGDGQGRRPATRLRTGLLALTVVLSAAAATGCASRDARGPRWRPQETLTARQAIDAQWPIADAQIGQAVRDRVIVGAEVVIVTEAGWSARGFGWATATSMPTESTIFELGSISKVFTGTLLGDMVARGEVAITEPAQNLVAGRGRMPPSASRPITLLDLATHMSGMPRLPPNMKSKNKKDPYADFGVDELWASLERTRLEREPGVQKEYSNFGAGLLGQLLVERADADSYEELLRERILDPLGMTDTMVEVRSELSPRFAWGHTKDTRRTPPWHIPGLAGAGGIRSTARDMAFFMQANLRQESPIAAAAAEALTARNIPGDGKWDQGLGWVVSRDQRWAWHNGQTGGFHTWVGLDREKRIGVLVLCNTATGDVDGMGNKILKELGRKLEAPAVALVDGALPWVQASAWDEPLALDVPEEVASR